jgi:hypothetical protein
MYELFSFFNDNKSRPKVLQKQQKWHLDLQKGTFTYNKDISLKFFTSSFKGLVIFFSCPARYSRGHIPAAPGLRPGCSYSTIVKDYGFLFCLAQIIFLRGLVIKTSFL